MLPGILIWLQLVLMTVPFSTSGEIVTFRVLEDYLGQCMVVSVRRSH